MEQERLKVLSPMHRTKALPVAESEVRNQLVQVRAEVGLGRRVFALNLRNHSGLTFRGGKCFPERGYHVHH